MKNILLILFLSINTLFGVTSDPLAIISTNMTYKLVDEYVQKENRIYNYIRTYELATLKQQPNRIDIINYFDDLDLSVWNNYAGDKCPATIDGVSYNDIGCLDFTLTPESTLLTKSLHITADDVPEEILNVYRDNSYELLNSYVIEDINRVYEHDKVYYYLLKLIDKIYNSGFENYISEEATEALKTDKIWLKPNKLNGVDLYLYNGNDWEFGGTIAYNSTTPYEITVDIDGIFNPDTFPGVINMTANVTVNDNLVIYIYDGTRWIEKKVNNSGLSFFDGYSNILPLTTTLLPKIGESKAIVTDEVFFPDNPNSMKYDVEEYDENGEKIDLLGFWLTDRKLEIFSDTFNNNIHYINNYANNVTYMFYPTKDQNEYIPMYKTNNYKWIYISKTNGYDGVFEYPYNSYDNESGPDIGSDITNTYHYILSWDTKNSRNDSLKQLFQYNNSDKVFYSKKDYLTGNNNYNIQISNNRYNFHDFISNTYLSKYSDCTNTTNLGDGRCHDNGLFAGDKIDNLYSWYYLNGKLYDAHKVNSYSEMYVKNSSNKYYPLIIYNNELYDLVLDNNNNVCYKRRTDGKYYTASGKPIPFYVNNIGILPSNKTCENVYINSNGLFEFEDMVELVDYYNDAPNNALGFVKSRNKNYTKYSDYWYNTTDNIYVTKFSRQKLPNKGSNKTYLTKILGSETDPLDVNKKYRYTDNGMKFTNGNSNENRTFYNWFNVITSKSLNNLIDADCQNVKYTSNACDALNGFVFNKNTNLCEKIKYYPVEYKYGIVGYRFSKERYNWAPKDGYTISFKVNYPVEITWKAFAEDTVLRVKADGKNIAYWGGYYWEGRCNKSIIITNNGCANPYIYYADVFSTKVLVKNDFYLHVEEDPYLDLKLLKIGYDIYINTFYNQNYPVSISGGEAVYGKVPYCSQGTLIDNKICKQVIHNSPNCINKKMSVYPYLDTPYYPYSNGNCYSDMANDCVDAGFNQTQIF